MKQLKMYSVKELEKMTPEQLELLDDELWTYRNRIRAIINYLKVLE